MNNNFLYCVLFFILYPMGVLSAQEKDEKEKPLFELGGALRFNYNLSSWKGEQKSRGGDFGYDMFRVEAKGTYQGISLNAEYRLYSDAFGGGFLKQGWLGYRFDEKNELQVGLTQVPFGIQEYNSHNWFFNLGYYVGLEDDFDMGVKFLHENDRISYQFAFFKNAEELAFGNTTEVSASRYSYDITGRNKEVNQFNGKFIYKLGQERSHQLGVSLQYGGIYNLDTRETGDHSGIAVHYEYTKNLWNVKVQAMSIANNPAVADTTTDAKIRMGAYGASYDVASDFNLYSASISRSLPVKLGPVTQLEFYNDFGFMDKFEADYTNTFMNVTGILVTAGHVYTYIDYAAGYNHSWLGGNFVDDFAEGNPDAKWEARFNINIGYYF